MLNQLPDDLLHLVLDSVDSIDLGVLKLVNHEYHDLVGTYTQASGRKIATAAQIIHDGAVKGSYERVKKFLPEEYEDLKRICTETANKYTELSGYLWEMPLSYSKKLLGLKEICIPPSRNVGTHYGTSFRVYPIDRLVGIAVAKQRGCLGFRRYREKCKRIAEKRRKT
jgi:hypothetical protein